tara:strand:+ start:65 stop:1606 length:1542 start_codon:yes stop_codon:yes gene_type:complete
MAALIINNVIDATSQIQYNYLESEEVFGYTITATYTIDVSDTNFQDGDTVLIQGREALQEAYRRPNIVARIAADEFINGRITDLSFDAGTLVGSEEAKVTIEESRRLESYAGTIFTKYIPNPQAISSFTEDYSFSRDKSNYSYTRNIGLTYNQDAQGQFLHDAKVFLTNYYFANRPSYGYQEDGISEDAKVDKNYRGLLSESYDLLALSVSLTEKFDSSFIDESNKVSREETQTLAVDEKGFVTKTFNFNLTSLRLDSQNVLSDALKSILDEVRSNNQVEFGEPFSINKGITKDGNSASLTVIFSTDPSKSQENSIIYTGTSTKNGVFTDFSLNVNYNSTGKNSREKFKNVKASWVAEQSNNTVRIRRLFHPTVDFFEKARNTTFAKTDGKITERVTFTTDPSYNTDEDGVLKFKIQSSKTHKIRRIEALKDLGDLHGKVVVNDLKTVGQASITAEAIASPTLGIFKAKDFLESKTSELNARVGEDIIHITSDVSSVNLGDGVANRVISYIFI